jgi:hypothetical protein
MGYYKNLIIAQQVEEPDRIKVPLPDRKIRRRVSYKSPEVVTDRRTLLILIGSSVFFSATTIGLVIVIAWIA